jgi:hypothetical protein
MVRIADRVWPAWREQAEQFDEPALLLLFSPAGDHGEAARALGESVLEVQAAYQAERERTGDPEASFAGEWGWVRVADGVLVQVVECDVLEEVRPAVAAGLERRGVEGAFDVRESPTVATLPDTAHLLECRVRVRGERMRRAPRDYLWQADREADEAFLAVAERWCRQRGQRAAHSLSAATVGPVPVAPGEDVLARMREEVAARMHIEVSAVTSDEFRSVAARAWSGGVSLVVGGAWVQAGQWRRALAELIGVLRDHADLLAYGYIKPGWEVTQALQEPALPHDWPTRPAYQPRGDGFTGEAFDDVYAPDAFGVQLLGPGLRRSPARQPGLAATAGRHRIVAARARRPSRLVRRPIRSARSSGATRRATTARGAHPGSNRACAHPLHPRCPHLRRPPGRRGPVALAGRRARQLVRLRRAARRPPRSPGRARTARSRCARRARARAARARREERRSSRA